MIQRTMTGVWSRRANWKQGTAIMAVLTLLSTILFADAPTREEKMEKGKAPYRVLFSNDSTNMLSCASPYHKKGEPFHPGLIKESVDETAGIGVDVHMLQPGLGVVPWWKSTVYPADEHYRWWKETYGTKSSWGEYMINGGDMVQVFVDRCRERGIAPFISLRLNDYHRKECLHMNVEQMKKAGGGASDCISRFNLDHPEYRLEPDPPEIQNLSDPFLVSKDPSLRTRLRAGRVLNWEHKAVRDRAFSFIQEICENYDIDGFELDFMRHSRHFRLDETTSEQRSEIMAGFVKQVRQVLDRTARPGQHRWLCARVPAFLEAMDPMGIDVRKMVDAGLEMINLSNHYTWEQQIDLPQVVQMVPEAAVYLEMTQTTMRSRRPDFDPKRGGASDLFRMTTDEQFYTAAHMAYARGGAGISVFNFHYYRLSGERVDPRVGEPPFHVFEAINDPARVGQMPQHYILNRGSTLPPIPKPMPRNVKQGQTAKFQMDMAPPDGGWKSEGRLRIQSDSRGGSIASMQLMCRFNGAELGETDNISEPYPNLYPATLGGPDTLRAWTVPVELMKDGMNTIEVTVVEGEQVKIIFIDLAVR